MQALAGLFGSSENGGQSVISTPRPAEFVKLVESTLPVLVDHQRILSQARVEPRFQIYPSVGSEQPPIQSLIDHWAWLNHQIDTICTENDNDTALKIIYGLGDYTNVSVSEHTCEYTWKEGGASTSSYRTHAIADELPIIVWLIGCRTMIEAVNHMVGGVEYLETSVSAAATKFAEAVKYFELHTTLGRKAGFQGYYQPEAPPHFARAYMGKAFSFLCMGLHQMCYGESRRLVNKLDRVHIVYHMHYYYLYIDKSCSLLESPHTRDAASAAIQNHIRDVQRRVALSWYEFYLAVVLYFDDQQNESWALDEMNAAIGGMTESVPYGWMCELRNELEYGAKSIAAKGATGLLLRNIRYVVNTKIITRKKIPHKTFSEEPTYQLFQS